MITRRPANERGHNQLGWLDTYHTFSFDTYFDPRHMGFRHLRVINEDRVEPGEGFGTHPHRDMEILTYILEGALEHKDSMGNGSIIHPGEIQRMSAGTGVTHSEFNPSATERVHLLQIWILPNQKNLAPGYEQKTFSAAERSNQWRLLAAKDAREGAVLIHQDVDVYTSILDPAAKLDFALSPGRHAWLQVARGAVNLNGHKLNAGDGAAISEEQKLRVIAVDASEVLLFDLA
ncbi:MAG: pirin family protein [Acidobacteriia bacterium]|nr:pirin family protein [Terriglobia bacterium]